MGAEEKDLELEEINWMMGSGMYIVIGANVHPYWQKSNKDVHSEIMYILIEAYWTMYIYRIYPKSKFATRQYLSGSWVLFRPVFLSGLGLKVFQPTRFSRPATPGCARSC